MIIAKKENHNYIDTIEQAREKITSIGQESKQTFEDMINNKETRDELIKMLRDNSSLTLKEIGKLFGGLSESRVSRIAKEQASKNRPHLLTHLLINQQVI
ncbi:MAG: hypothetical protein LRZ99_00010 [Desulfotomaculum sp.]|nr:hypothetical protein [Desulfotomaculum sp.]